MTKTDQSTLKGAAGEHYIMFRLLQQGFIAGLAPQGAPHADIIVSNVDGSKSVAIQVKTKMHSGADGGWYMRSKHEDIQAKNIFYCFVDLADISQPAVYIISSNIVAKTLKETHAIWLSTPGARGQKHNDSKMRRLLPDCSKEIKNNQVIANKYGPGWMEKYKENWNLLGLK